MNNWVNEVRVAIILRAMEDYREHMREREYEKGLALEKWFVSEWGQALSGNLGEEIVKRLRKELFQHGT